MDLTNIGGFFAVDIIVVVIILISSLLALARGFVRELFSLLAWAGTFVLTYIFYKPFSIKIQQWFGIQDELWAIIFSVASIFIVSIIILMLIAISIASLVTKTKLGPIDRSLGFLFGVLRGGFIVCVFYFLGSLMVPAEKQPDWIQNAKTKPMMEKGVNIIKPALEKFAGWVMAAMPQNVTKDMPSLFEEPQTDKPLNSQDQEKETSPDLSIDNEVEQLKQPKVQGDQSRKEGYSNSERSDLQRTLDILETIPTFMPSEEEKQ